MDSLTQEEIANAVRGNLFEDLEVICQTARCAGIPVAEIKEIFLAVLKETRTRDECGCTQTGDDKKRRRMGESASRGRGAESAELAEGRRRRRTESEIDSRYKNLSYSSGFSLRCDPRDPKKDRLLTSSCSF
jgi:hypothetical protein